MEGVAFITGAASGIGAACAQTFCDHGVSNFILLDIQREALAQIAKLLEATTTRPIEILTIECNVADEMAVNQAVAQGVERFGRIDFAVNSAGITNKSKVGDYETKEWERVIAVNQTGVFNCMRAQLAQMEKQDPLPTSSGSTEPVRFQRGSIVNICSINSFVSARRNAAYVTSKHAVLGLTRTCGLDYAEQKIRCNGVAPGYIGTNLTLRPENIATLSKATAPDKTPAGRPGLPEEIADVVVFLSSHRASYVNGACWEVDGGYLTL